MLRLRACILSHLSPASTRPLSSLHRLRHLSAGTAAPSVSADPGFAIQDYLVAACGLTRPQAIKASTELSHLKSPSNPDAVLAFLGDLGISSADVAALVARDPRFLCARVDATLAPTVTALAPLVPDSFRCKSVVPSLHYYTQLFGSVENLLLALRRNHRLFNSDLERVVKPNVALLQECRLGACDIAKLCVRAPRLLITSPERVLAMVARTEGLGAPRGSGTFKHLLQAVAFHEYEEKIAAKLENLKKTLSWSTAEVTVALSMAPGVLVYSEDKLRRLAEFLVSEVGLEPAYIAHRAKILTLSLEGRLRPRYYVTKFLKDNGLLKHDRTYFSAVNITDRVFVDKWIHPHKEAAPHLAQDYADACRLGSHSSEPAQGHGNGQPSLYSHKRWEALLLCLPPSCFLGS